MFTISQYTSSFVIGHVKYNFPILGSVVSLYLKTMLKSNAAEVICSCNGEVFKGGVQNRLYQTFGDIIKTEEHCVRLQEDAHCSSY